MKPESSVTKTEKDILFLVCKQKSIEEISRELFLSPRTVEGYKSNLFEKTNTESNKELLLYALKNKVI